MALTDEMELNLVRDNNIRISWIKISQLNMRISVEMATLLINHSKSDGNPSNLNIIIPRIRIS